MNDPDVVSESTRNRVLGVMKKLNYTPNWFARNLQKKRTNVIGLLIPDTLEQSYMELAKGVEKVARQKDCNIIICSTDYDPENEMTNAENLIERRIDGMILAASSLKKEDIGLLHRKGVPFVLTDRTDCGGSENVVSTNYREAAASATEHFIQMGRKRIAMIMSEKGEFIGECKAAGFKDALSAHGMDPQKAVIIKTEDSIKGGMLAAGRLLEQEERPDAVFAATDTMAFGVLERIRQAGLDADDIGVIGYDDLPTGSIVEPKLTTVVKPAYRMGLTAARLLFDSIEDEEMASEPQSIVLQSRLKVRKSCGNKERLREIL